MIGRLCLTECGICRTELFGHAREHLCSKLFGRRNNGAAQPVYKAAHVAVGKVGCLKRIFQR